MSLSVAGHRRLLQEDHVGDALKDAKEGLTDFAESFWGGSCLSQDQCSDYVATCGGQGRCTRFASLHRKLDSCEMIFHQCFR